MRRVEEPESARKISPAGCPSGGGDIFLSLSFTPPHHGQVERISMSRVEEPESARKISFSPPHVLQPERISMRRVEEKESFSS